ncbi:zinc ribbon domain-containing protein [Alistipes sp.]|uniref:zinc ribbon domain-containing protein n=1 Tax=Alistipes sp. TaxID=1872444 RepID=UPI003AF11BD8
MKKCPNCGTVLADDNARFCPACGRECPTSAPKPAPQPAAPPTAEPDAGPLVGDKNLINDSTIVGKQENYEASNITIHNNITEDHSHMTVVCAVSGKRIYLDHSVVCPQCGKQVALEYYIERSKRCETCEEEARGEFRTTAARITAEGPLDAARKRQLDAEAERLHLDGESRMAILRSLQQQTPVRNPKLSSLQEAELETAVGQLKRTDAPEEQAKAMETLAVLHDLTANYAAEYWYFLARAILEPEAAVKSYEEELTDIYWQRYWGFLAYCRIGSPKGSAALERVRTAFGEHEDDIRLAEAAYYLARGFESSDQTMIRRAGTIGGQIRREYLSQPLIEVHDALRALMDNDMSPEGSFDAGQLFVLLAVFRAGKQIDRLRAERAAQEAAARAEHERQERERAAAEQARRERQAALAAERARRLERELGRPEGQKPKPESADAPAKAFAGFDTPVLPEKKRGGWKRTAAIAVGILLLILIALFLIPAPDSLQ